MRAAILEHVNVTVSNPQKTAKWLCDVFGWKIRWHGPSLLGGTTYHVGEDKSYLAVYSKGSPDKPAVPSNRMLNGLNHVGIVVEDLDGIEKRVLAKGFKTSNHDDYDPGRRFYFHDDDGIEYEVVSYAPVFSGAMKEIAMAGIARK